MTFYIFVLCFTLTNITKEQQMSNKKVVLMNDVDAVCQIYGDTKQTKLNVCTWNDKQQTKFIKSLHEFKAIKDDECLCNFSVEYDNICLADIGLDDGVACTIDDWTDEFRQCDDTELVILMDPKIPRSNDDKLMKQYNCKCGAEHSCECPKKIKNGKCTAPAIQKLIGQVLFPDKYVKSK